MLTATKVEKPESQRLKGQMNKPGPGGTKSRSSSSSGVVMPAERRFMVDTDILKQIRMLKRLGLDDGSPSSEEDSEAPSAILAQDEYTLLCQEESSSSEHAPPVAACVSHIVAANPPCSLDQSTPAFQDDWRPGEGLKPLPPRSLIRLSGKGKGKDHHSKGKDKGSDQGSGCQINWGPAPPLYPPPAHFLVPRRRENSSPEDAGINIHGPRPLHRPPPVSHDTHDAGWNQKRHKSDRHDAGCNRKQDAGWNQTGWDWNDDGDWKRSDWRPHDDGDWKRSERMPIAIGAMPK